MKQILVTNPDMSNTSLSVDIEEFHPHHGWQRRQIALLNPGASFETTVEKHRRRILINEE
jgi:hypothetical protein